MGYGGELEDISKVVKSTLERNKEEESLNKNVKEFKESFDNNNPLTDLIKKVVDKKEKKEK